jgi:hypothetical protein
MGREQPSRNLAASPVRGCLSAGVPHERQSAPQWPSASHFEGFIG